MNRFTNVDIYCAVAACATAYVAVRFPLVLLGMALYLAFVFMRWLCCRHPFMAAGLVAFLNGLFHGRGGGRWWW